MSSQSPARRLLAALLTLLATLVATVGLVTASAGTAYAEEGYRYWNYSHLEGDAFAFAQTGPGDHTPKDGDVEGWRFGTSTASQGIFPRADLATVTFDSACEGVEAADGEKRVALLVDFGTEADADGAEVPEPRAECATVPADATGRQVLESVVEVRSDREMICALDGYPAKGCGDLVADAEVSADEQPVAFAVPAAEDTENVAAETEDDGALSWPLVAVLVAVVLLGGAALLLSRRNRDA
jgi:hypothetical protein